MHRLPVSLCRMAEVTSDQGHNCHREDRVGGHVHIVVGERVQENRQQAEGSAHHERSFVVLLCSEIVLSPLNMFPPAEHVPGKQRPRRGNEQRANQAPIHEGVKIIVVNAFRPHLHLVWISAERPVLAKAKIEMTGPGASPEMVAPYFERWPPDSAPQIVLANDSREVFPTVGA